MSTSSARILIAAFGSVLRGDDGFGSAVLERLRTHAFGGDVRLLEVGVAGVRLIQELLSGYDALLLVDTVDLGLPAGAVVVVEPAVADPRALGPAARHAAAADVHHTTIAHALLHARALDVLPAVVRLIGCQPAAIADDRVGLSAAVQPAVSRAVGEVVRQVAALRGAAA